MGQPRKISLFIAMSLDGYIADIRGGVDWLKGHGGEEENIDTYSGFIKDIDTVLMGWNTYNQIVTELSPLEWVYRGLKTYVFTHRKYSSGEDIEFTDQNPVCQVRELQGKTGKGIWICGGASIVKQLMDADMIDEYYISMIPVLLGSGIRLFENGKKEIKLKLVNTQNYNGIVDLIYTRR